MVTFFGNRHLRAEPGRVAAWQQGLDDAAGRAGIELLWCMALPGDFAATVDLDHVIAVRTCDDYRFADGTLRITPIEEVERLRQERTFNFATQAALDNAQEQIRRLRVALKEVRSMVWTSDVC